MRYQVWYQKKLSHFGALPDRPVQGVTHLFVREVSAHGLQAAYRLMQGEVWSPNGEAYTLIRRLGLHHTSMSAGDILVDAQGNAFLVDWVGFRPVRWADAVPSQPAPHKQCVVP